MKKTFIIFSILFAAAFFAGPYSYAQEKLDDLDITDAIEDQYLFDHAINVNNIDIMVINGIVALTGTVHNLQAKERATKIAEMVKGVRSVSNRIEVDPPVVLSDSGIRDMAKEALFNDPATDSYEVDVAVNNNVVTLTGSVDSYQEKELCANVVKSVNGVVDLKNEISINFKTVRPDYEIQTEIKQALKWSESVDDGLIHVKVDNGNVSLSGTVGSAAEKSNARWTSWVSGVKSVDDTELDVEWWAKDTDLRANKNVAVSDREIEEAIKDASLYDPRLLSFNINPEADAGWVTLRGMVNNLKAKKAAENLAENTLGVQGVINRLKVRIDLPLTDREIENKIASALANNIVTEDLTIDVKVDYGTATLFGAVDLYAEKEEAEWVASGIKGVNEVNNKLTVDFPYGYYWYGPYPYYNWYHPQENSEERIAIPNDAAIKRKIENKIRWNPWVNADQVEVDVENGTVTLNGTVDSKREYSKAAENAWEGGAWSVDNNLVIDNQ